MDWYSVLAGKAEPGRVKLKASTQGNLWLPLGRMF